MMMKEKISNIKIRNTGFFKMLFLLVPLFILALHSCTERIDIKTDESFQKLAVEGYVTAQIQYVRLTKTSGYFSQEAPEPVREALVTVSDSINIYSFSESADQPGYYTPENTIPTKTGNKYKLTIDLKNKIGGETHFESEEATMPGFSGSIDSIRTIWRGQFDRWIIKLYAYEPPGPDYYMFSAQRNGIWVTDSLSRIGLTDDRLVDGQYLPGIYVLSLYQDELEVGDTVTLFTSSITHDYYRYLDEARQELAPKAPLFSGPPANVRSNISNGALGYFAVYSSVATTSVIDSSGIWE